MGYNIVAIYCFSRTSDWNGWACDMSKFLSNEQTLGTAVGILSKEHILLLQIHTELPQKVSLLFQILWSDLPFCNNYFHLQSLSSLPYLL
jgi:hypothetical protein